MPSSVAPSSVGVILTPLRARGLPLLVFGRGPFFFVVAMPIAYHAPGMLCKRPLVNPYADVRPGGYAWWYFDAVSDDGARALTAIFFIGSVFSPDYAARLRRGEPARAEEHLGVNLALYERGHKRAWVMSEHGAAALGGVGDGGPQIGESKIDRLPSGGLRLTIREHTAPFLV